MLEKIFDYLTHDNDAWFVVHLFRSLFAGFMVIVCLMVAPLFMLYVLPLLLCISILAGFEFHLRLYAFVRGADESMEQFVRGFLIDGGQHFDYGRGYSIGDQLEYYSRGV